MASRLSLPATKTSPYHRTTAIAVSQSAVPRDFACSFFSAYKTFNKIQSAVLKDSLFSNTNLVVSAPTGSGKTVLFELAICRHLTHRIPGQIIYICPTKSLADERARDWAHKLQCYQRRKDKTDRAQGEKLGKEGHRYESQDFHGDENYYSPSTCHESKHNHDKGNRNYGETQLTDSNTQHYIRKRKKKVAFDVPKNDKTCSMTVKLLVGQDFCDVTEYYREMEEVIKATILVTTPEKLDAVTRTRNGMGLAARCVSISLLFMYSMTVYYFFLGGGG